jgi:ABC-type amino acid transport substrate-binding protein
MTQDPVSDSIIKNLVGRPQKCGPFGRRFLELYQNPFLHPQEICRALSISLATFYRYEKELNFPTLKVGVANSSKLPNSKALKTFRTLPEKYDALILQELAKILPVRFKLISLDFDSFEQVKSVSSSEVDFAIGSISWTKERSENLYFTEPYLFYERPHGKLLFLKDESLKIDPQTKPILSVPCGSVHSEYAETHLLHEFQVRKFASAHAAVKAVVDRKVYAALLHPGWLDILNIDKAQFKISEKVYHYESFTGLVFHKQSEKYLEIFNLALEKLNDRKKFDLIFKALESND